MFMKSMFIVKVNQKVATLFQKAENHTGHPAAPRRLSVLQFNNTFTFGTRVGPASVRKNKNIRHSFQQWPNMTCLDKTDFPVTYSHIVSASRDKWRLTQLM